MGNLRLEEVFKLSGVPTFTFVEPPEYKKLLVSLRTPGRGIVIEGPSGIGKTTAVIRALKDLEIEAESLRLSGRKQDDVQLIEDLPAQNAVGTVIIDDFHKLSIENQNALANMVKVLADEEDSQSKLVIVGINRVGNTLVELASDLNTRIDVIRFEANPDERVYELLAKGEEALSVQFNTKDDIVRSAAGSFFLAQLLAHETCLLADVTEAPEAPLAIETSLETVHARVMDQLDRGFQSQVKEFCLGLRKRTDGRAPYLFLLKWLSESSEWTLDVRDAIRQHPEHRGSVGQIVENGSVELMFESDPTLGEVLHYDPRSSQLTVEDPKFVFYLRNLGWHQFAQALGFGNFEISARYDFALSFAGADRAVAQALFDILSDEFELSVFYDKNEQHRILGQDVEEYLKPIYRSEAAFVVVLLGPDYPKRVWTKFESDLFKERFGEGAVIPIWFSNAEPGIFDDSIRVGGITFDPSGDIKSQINAIATVLIKRLRE